MLSSNLLLTLVIYDFDAQRTLALLLRNSFFLDPTLILRMGTPAKINEAGDRDWIKKHWPASRSLISPFTFS